MLPQNGYNVVMIVKPCCLVLELVVWQGVTPSVGTIGTVINREFVHGFFYLCCYA
jgi:hypothetical protein